MSEEHSLQREQRYIRSFSKLISLIIIDEFANSLRLILQFSSWLILRLVVIASIFVEIFFKLPNTVKFINIFYYRDVPIPTKYS